MNRRELIKLFVTSAIGAVITYPDLKFDDVVEGMAEDAGFDIDELFNAEIKEFVRLIVAQMNRDSVFFKMLENKEAEIVSARDMRIPIKIKPGGNFGKY